MEVWEVLDENRNKTGKTVIRGNKMQADEYHLVVHVWIKNSKGDYLISKRTPNKTFPNMWETTGGSAVLGDTSIEAALREVKEEIGIDLNERDGRLIHTSKYQHKDFPQFADVYLFKSEVNIKNVIYQEDEVCDAKWASEKEIREMIKSKEFVDVFDYLDELFKLD